MFSEFLYNILISIHRGLSNQTFYSMMVNDHNIIIYTRITVRYTKPIETKVAIILYLGRTLIPHPLKQMSALK